MWTSVATITTSRAALRAYAWYLNEHNVFAYTAQFDEAEHLPPGHARDTLAFLVLIKKFPDTEAALRRENALSTSVLLRYGTSPSCALLASVDHSRWHSVQVPANGLPLCGGTSSTDAQSVAKVPAMLGSAATNGMDPHNGSPFAQDLYSGRIATCMGCHDAAPHGKLFGLPAR